MRGTDDTAAERDRLARTLRETRLQLAMTQARLGALEQSATMELGLTLVRAARRPDAASAELSARAVTEPGITVRRPFEERLLEGRGPIRPAAAVELLARLDAEQRHELVVLRGRAVSAAAEQRHIRPHHRGADDDRPLGEGKYENPGDQIGGVIGDARGIHVVSAWYGRCRSN